MDSVKVFIDTVKIIPQSSNNNWPSVEVLSLLVALLAVVVGPLFQLYIAKINIRADVVYQNQQRWIHMVRRNISEFIAAILLLKTGEIPEELRDEKIFDMKEKIYRLKAMIQMQLRYDNTEDMEFVEHMNAVTALVEKEDSIDKVKGEINELTRHGQKIVIDVWRKIEMQKKR